MSTSMAGKNVWWLYQARRVNTQTNAGGGALTTRLSLATGQVGILVQASMVGAASAAATAEAKCMDEDGALTAYWGYVAAGASRVINFPTIGTAPTHNNVTNTQNAVLGPGQIISFTTGTALQNETLTVGIVLLLSTSTAPTWDTTGSGGTPSLAASTVSAANTLQAVVM